MAALHSPYLWTIVLLAIWAGADSQETTCAEGGGTCVPEDDNSCAHEANYPGCDEDEICCTSASAVFVKRDADSCHNVAAPGKYKKYEGICETECHPDRIYVGQCNTECKCCGCKIEPLCKKKNGHCIRIGVDECIGDTDDELCHGRKCACCIPDDGQPEESCNCTQVEGGCVITEGEGAGKEWKCKCTLLADGCVGEASKCGIEICLGETDYCACLQGKGDDGNCGGYPTPHPECPPYPCNCTNPDFWTPPLYKITNIEYYLNDTTTGSLKVLAIESSTINNTASQTQTTSFGVTQELIRSYKFTFTYGTTVEYGRSITWGIPFWFIITDSIKVSNTRTFSMSITQTEKMSFSQTYTCTGAPNRVTECTILMTEGTLVVPYVMTLTNIASNIEKPCECPSYGHVTSSSYYDATLNVIEY